MYRLGIPPMAVAATICALLMCGPLVCAESDAGLPPGAQPVTEETILDASADVKMIGEGHALIDPGSGEKIKVGQWKYTTPGVAMYSIENYNAKGELDGMKVVYAREGRPLQIVHYIDGLQHGVAQSFNPGTGKVLREAEYKHGVLDGWVTTYAADGAVKSRVLYADGKVKE